MEHNRDSIKTIEMKQFYRRPQGRTRNSYLNYIEGFGRRRKIAAGEVSNMMRDLGAWRRWLETHAERHMGARERKKKLLVGDTQVHYCLPVSLLYPLFYKCLKISINTYKNLNKTRNNAMMQEPWTYIC